jgi:hypothetical protein
MRDYVLTPLVKADIFNIWTYIAENSESIADRVEQAIYEACALLAQGPSRGYSRPDLTTRSLRLWTLPAIPTTPLFTGQRLTRCRSLPSFTANGISAASSGSARDCYKEK